jgi:hypothetical protein
MTDKLNKLFTTILPVASIKQLGVAVGIIVAAFMAGIGFTTFLGAYSTIPEEHEEFRESIVKVRERVTELEFQVDNRLHVLERNTNTIICLIEADDSGTNECRPPLFPSGF